MSREAACRCNQFLFGNIQAFQKSTVQAQACLSPARELRNFQKISRLHLRHFPSEYSKRLPRPSTRPFIVSHPIGNRSISGYTPLPARKFPLRIFLYSYIHEFVKRISVRQLPLSLPFSSRIRYVKTSQERRFSLKRLFVSPAMKALSKRFRSR